MSYPVQGIGATSCAQFAKAYQADPQGASDLYFAWAQGLMSGLNMANLAAKRPAKELGVRVSDQEQQIKAYCADNPLRTYMDAILDLFKSLPVFKKDE